jgi:hypothetical protein
MSMGSLWAGRDDDAPIEAPQVAVTAPVSAQPAIRRRVRVMRRRMPARQRPRVVDALGGLAGLGLGITLALGISAESAGSLRAAGGVATALGRISGLSAAYAMVVVVVLVARFGPLERAVGQDRLVRWHRTLGPWPLFLLCAHGVLITVGYAQAAHDGVLHQFGQLLWTYPGILAATVGFVLLIVAGVTSYRIARRRSRTRHGGRCISTPISHCFCRSRIRWTRARRSSGIRGPRRGGPRCAPRRWGWWSWRGLGCRCGARRCTA